MWTALRTLLAQRAESAEPSSFVRVPANAHSGPIRAEIRVGTLVLGGGATSVILTIWRQVGARIDKIRNIIVPTAEGALAQTVDLYGGDLAVTVKSFPDGAEGGATAITGASNEDPIEISSVGHGLSTGNQVLVEGVTGNTAANGVFLLHSTGNDTFSLDGSVGNGAYAGGGTWLLVTDVLGANGTVEARSVDPHRMPHGVSLG